MRGKANIETHLATCKLDATKVSQLDISFVIQENIAAFDVSMDDILLVEVLQSFQQLSGVLLNNQLLKFPLLLEYIGE